MVKKAYEAPLAPFGVAIRAAIERSPFANRTRFCEAARLQPKQLRRYELGTVAPRLDQVAAWAELLECSVSDLLPDIGNQVASPESRVERDADEGHPVVEAFIEDNRGDLSDDEVARLRRNFYRGADEDFVREHLPKYLLSMRRAPKVEDRGEVAKPVVREGARRIAPVRR